MTQLIKKAIIVIERAMKAIKPKTINACWENYLDVVHEFRGLMTKPINDIITDYECDKKVGSEVF